MIRVFEQHKIRRQRELDGFWDFRKEDGTQYQLPVPGCWEQHPDMIRYRGKGVYCRTFSLDRMTNLRLELKGVSHTADVYVDGVKIAHHYNAFTPFAGIVKNAAAGEHEIKIEVDNSFSEQSALHIPNDYYTYGGITRPAVLEEIPDCYIERIHFTPRLINGVWTAKIEALVSNISAGDKTVILSGSLKECRSLGGKDRLAAQEYAVADRECAVKAGEQAAAVWELEFPQAKSWSSEKPDLYYLQLQINDGDQPLDDLIERVGFRQVEIRDRKICVNGNPIFMKGFNRHEDYGEIGCAIPPQLMAQDLDLIQDMGANAVRTCHYPNDERFLDLCDERGIFVWEENHARGLNLDRMQNPNFERQCEDCIREMIENHYNHPAIVIWGILNECASDTQEGRRMYAKQYEQIRQLDQTRPVTSATCRHFRDVCLDLPDVVSFNQYSGWYEDVPVKERHDQEMDWIASAGGAQKPVIVSEFGAGAVYGYRDRGHSKWSEERQADVIRENIEVYQQDERLSGIFIWQFADCRVTEEGGWFSSRARSHNNKGVVDEYRRSKEAYEEVKRLFRRFPV